MLHGQAELGITIVMTKNPEIAEQPILREPFALFCRDDHPLAREKSVSWRDVREAELIVVSSASGNRALLDYQLARHRIDVNGNYEVHHPSTALGLVVAGVGVAILPLSIIQEGTHPNVRRIPLVRPSVARTISLVRKGKATLSPAAEAFYEMLATGESAPAGEKGQKR